MQKGEKEHSKKGIIKKIDYNELWKLMEILQKINKIYIW